MIKLILMWIYSLDGGGDIGDDGPPSVCARPPPLTVP